MFKSIHRDDDVTHQAILSLAWNPHRINLLATIGFDKRLNILLLSNVK